MRKDNYVDADQIINNCRGEVPSPYEVSPNIKVSPVHRKSGTEKNKGGETPPLQKDLPEGWDWKTMGEISDVVGGGTPRTNVPEYYDNGAIPWITPADLSGYKNKYISRGSRSITETGLRNSSARLMPAGTVLFTSRAPIGYVAIAKNPISTNQGFKSFVLIDGILPDYIYWYLKGNKNLAESLASGTTFLELSGAKAKQIPVPVAPLDKQKLIVAEIEKEFSRLDEAVAALKRIQANLKRYKAAVLKAAVEGKLTEQWRKEHPDVEPAGELLKRILAERHKKWEEDYVKKYLGAHGHAPKYDLWKKKYKEQARPDTTNLPKLLKGWVWTTIGQIAECLDSMRVPVNKKARAVRQGSIPYYGANGQVGWIDGYLFDEALVLVVEDETFTGRELPFSYKISGKSWVNNHAHVLRNSKAVNVDFLNYSLVHYPFTPLTTGTTGRKKLTQAALLSALYKLPPLSEQIEIVNRIESCFSVAVEIEAAIETNLKRAERMRQAILKKAFSGKLIQ